jgi:hypothetical protein
MTLAKEGKGASASVTWRLPLRVAAEMNGDWSPMRDVLDEWAEDYYELEPEESEETTSVCLRISHDTLKALDREAKRLSKVTGKKWTAGKVARALWDLHEEEAGEG